MRTSGFTLIEVVVATLVFQLSVLAAVSTLTYATRVLTDAVVMEARADALEATVDSLRTTHAARTGVRLVNSDTISWHSSRPDERMLSGRGVRWADSVAVAVEVWRAP